MTTKTRIIPALLLSAMLLPLSVSAYTYTVSNGKATITKYNGSGGDVSIPSSLNGYSVTSIGYKAFSSCSSLTSVNIPDSVTYIGSYAFSACTSLTNATIGNSVTYIGEYAFDYCPALTSVIIPDSVTYIGSRAFQQCSLWNP